MITKRQLGIGFIAIGLITILAPFAIDWWRSASLQAYIPLIGPTQIAAVIGGAACILVGISLLPLGDRPA